MKLDWYESWWYYSIMKKSSLCQRNNLNVKVKSLLFLFVASFCLQIFFFLNIAPIFSSCFYLTLLFRCNENFIKQKFFIPVGSFCLVCIKNVHVLMRKMWRRRRRRRMKGTRKCCISYFCSVYSFNSQPERSTSE